MTRGHGAPARPARRLVINWALVEQRRIAAGMTHAQLAQRVGVAAVTGPVRLWHDRDHDTVRLGLLERLCQVLDLHPVELFTAPTTRAQQRRALQPADDPPDEQVLEAALATLAASSASGQQPTPIGRAGLVDALGWPLHRLAAALAALDHTLADRGVRIDEDVDGDDRAVHGLRPRSGLLTPAQREALHRRAQADEPLDVDAVRALYAIAQPDSRYTERHTVIGTDAIRLQQLGLVHRRHRARNLELADDVRYGLLLDPP